MNIHKDTEIDHDTCRSRSAIRRTKDPSRISTSNLNKKELEDVYYSLFDSNIELKKTINAQKEQIKLLTTRVSRLTQKNIYSPQKGPNKNTLNEHKDIIIDLKQANERLVERVRLLSMQLCSAKQFVKRNPLQTRCQNCANIRNSSSVTLLNTKRSHPNLRTKSTASQYDIEPDIAEILEETLKDSIPTKETEECMQNKCKALVEQLQMNIDDLKQELSKSNEKYANDIQKFTDFEKEVCGLKEENLKIRTQVRLSEERMQQQRTEYQELLKNLRTVEARHETVALELLLEKQKSRELETQLKAAEISHTIVQALSQAAARADIRESVRVDESRETMRGDGSRETIRVDDTREFMNGDESRETMRLESLTPMKYDEALTLVKGNKPSLIPVRVESYQGMRVDETSHASSVRLYESSHTPVRLDESSHTAVRLDVSLEKSPNKVEQSDDSGYLEAAQNKMLEYGSEIRLDEIKEHVKEDTNTSADYKRKRRKGKSRRSKRDSSIESSVDGNADSKEVGDGIEKDDYNSEDKKELSRIHETIRKKVLKDVGIQSVEKKYVSRAVGDILEGARADAEVQIGDSLCAMPDIDTRTYSRRSRRTYSLPAPHAPSVPYAPSVPDASHAPRDSTEGEISSLSDLPSEREMTPSDYISPGEAVTSSEYTGASSWSELSEGELPAPHILSYGEVDPNTSIGEQKRPVSPRVRLDRARRAAQEEVDRVSRLLAGRPVDLPGGTVNPMLLLRARRR